MGNGGHGTELSGECCADQNVPPILSFSGNWLYGVGCTCSMAINSIWASDKEFQSRFVCVDGAVPIGVVASWAQRSEMPVSNPTARVDDLINEFLMLIYSILNSKKRPLLRVQSQITRFFRSIMRLRSEFIGKNSQSNYLLRRKNLIRTVYLPIRRKKQNLSKNLRIF